MISSLKVVNRNYNWLSSHALISVFPLIGAHPLGHFVGRMLNGNWVISCWKWIFKMNALTLQSLNSQLLHVTIDDFRSSFCSKTSQFLNFNCIYISWFQLYVVIFPICLWIKVDCEWRKIKRIKVPNESKKEFPENLIQTDKILWLRSSLLTPDQQPLLRCA